MSAHEDEDALDDGEPDMGIVTRDLAHAASIIATIPRLHDDAPDPCDDEQPSLVRAAYHEAGHAVVSMVLGVGVERVWVHENGTGRCETTGDTSATGDLSAVAWAGLVAECVAAALCLRKSFECWWDRGDDACKVARMTFDDPEAASAGIRVAAEIISAQRLELDALARLLMVHGSACPDAATPGGWKSPA